MDFGILLWSVLNIPTKSEKQLKKKEDVRITQVTRHLKALVSHPKFQALPESYSSGLVYRLRLMRHDWTGCGKTGGVC